MKGITWPWSWGEVFKLAVFSSSRQVKKGSKFKVQGSIARLLQLRTVTANCNCLLRTPTKGSSGQFLVAVGR